MSMSGVSVSVIRKKIKMSGLAQEREERGERRDRMADIHNIYELKSVLFEEVGGGGLCEMEIV